MDTNALRFQSEIPADRQAGAIENQKLLDVTGVPPVPLTPLTTLRNPPSPYFPQRSRARSGHLSNA